MSREAGQPVETRSERGSERGSERVGGGGNFDSAALSRNTWAGVESNGKKPSEPTGPLRFDDKPSIYTDQPNQKFAGLSTGTLTDAGGGDGKPKSGAADSVVSRQSKRNDIGGYTDTAVHSDGSIDTTTSDKSHQAIKNRTDYPDKSFNEQTLDKHHNLKVREQKANGDFTETNITHDGQITSKSRTTNGDGSHTDVAVDATGKTDSSTFSEKGQLIGKKTENPDHSYNERKVNPDGSVVFHDQQKNGSYVETLTNREGTSRTVHDVAQNGDSTTKTYDPKGNVVKDRVTNADGSYFETTKNKDGTTTKHDQKSNGDFSEAILNDKGELVSPVLDVKSTASADFVRRVRDQIATLPDNVKGLLAKDGTHVVATGMVLDAAPELAGKKPRGHDPGSSWNDLDGGQPGKQIIVAERDSKGYSNRLDGLLKHETGHAVDRALGYDSSSPEFKAAYDKDVAAMTPEQQKREKYMLQTGADGAGAEAGRSEAFAEVFGAINGSSNNRSETGDRLQDFPNLTAYMKKRMNEIPQ